jgi:hypothetical protein
MSRWKTYRIRFSGICLVVPKVDFLESSWGESMIVRCEGCGEVLGYRCEETPMGWGHTRVDLVEVEAHRCVTIDPPRPSLEAQVREVVRVRVDERIENQLFQVVCALLAKCENVNRFPDILITAEGIVGEVRACANAYVKRLGNSHV